MISALKLIKSFCKYDFEERDVEKALGVLSENISWFGTADGEDVHSLSEAREYITNEISLLPSPYSVEFFDEHELVLSDSSCSANLRARVSNAGIDMLVRISVSAARIDGKDCIVTMHMSVSDSAQKDGEYYPITVAKETINKLRQELLSDAVAGGMMGGYVEDGFPFYFINHRMLEYLGYESEKEFVNDIDGMISNCMHPDDRDFVAETTIAQLEKSGEYTVEYRMKKKDNSYIWVHDIGRKATAEDGRDAIISVCYDITDERDKNHLFEQLMTSINGGIAIYKIIGGNARAEYISDGVASILGMSAAEYRENYGENIVSSIYEADRAMMADAVRRTMLEDKPTSLTYRSPHKNGGYIWVNGMFSRYVSPEGQALLRAVFTPASQQFEAQVKILDLTANGIYIISKDNYELYYINRPGIDVLDVEPCAYTGRKCYEILHGRSTPCEYCGLHKAAKTNQSIEIYAPDLGKTFNVNAKEIKWNGKDAIIEYLSDITEEKVSKEKLRRSEQITEAASDFAGMWLWTYDIQNNTAHFYKKLREDSKLPETMENYPESWLGLGYISKEYTELYRDSVNKLKEGQARVEFDCKARLKSKDAGWIRCRFNILSFENRKPKLAVCTCQPIDTEKALEARVQLEQQKPFANRQSLLGYSISNLTKNIVVSHRELRKNSPVTTDGITVEEAAKLSAKSIPDESVRKRYIDMHKVPSLLKFYAQGGTSDTIEFRRDLIDGSSLWVRNTMDILRDPATGNIFMYEYCYDINLEKKNKLALDSLINDETDYISIVNTKTGRGRLINSSEAYMRNDYWQDYVYSDVMNKLVTERVTDEDKEKCRTFFSLPLLIEKLKNENSASLIYSVTQNGSLRRKKMKYYYLDSTHEDVVLARSDVTFIYEEEKKQKLLLQQALDKANQASRAKSDFLSQMSHEIRTPMNAIMGMTRLAEDIVTDPAALDYLRKIDASSDYLLGILNDVLDMSRIENGKLILKPEWVCAADVVDDCLNMVLPTAQAKNIKFIAPSVERVRAYEYYVDPLRTKQVIMNILNNALKFTPEGGTITFEAHALSSTKDFCTEQLAISDTGCGMSKEFLERIFTPFEQERNPLSDVVQGTGLGLALVKNIIGAMGGDITVESELGKGSRFAVTFPHPYRLSQKSKAAEKDSSAKEISLEGRRILLVDDHPLNREIAKKLLDKKNAVVYLASNGKEAVDKFILSEEGFYDVILMDIKMPVMNGLEATKCIRSQNRSDAKTVPIIAMTANAFDEDVQQSKSAGMNAHLAKPINPLLLFSTLKEHIGKNKN